MRNEHDANDALFNTLQDYGSHYASTPYKARRRRMLVARYRHEVMVHKALLLLAGIAIGTAIVGAAIYFQGAL